MELYRILLVFIKASYLLTKYCIKYHNALQVIAVVWCLLLLIIASAELVRLVLLYIRVSHGIMSRVSEASD